MKNCKENTPPSAGATPAPAIPNDVNTMKQDHAPNSTSPAARLAISTANTA